jgi:phosphoribosylformylglycinamidine (FGAM) synthase PurS component
VRLSTLLCAVCVLASSGLSRMPRFNTGDVVRRVRSARSLSSAVGSEQLLDGVEFLVDTSVTRVPAQANQFYPAVASDGANFLVVWQDDRSGVIFGARVTPEGAVLDPLGIMITPAPGDRGAPDLGYDGNNFLVVWEEDRDYSEWVIYGARVTPGGAVLDPAGFAISSVVDDQMMPALAFDGTNFCVVWEDDRDDTLYDIYGARVTPEGAVLDPTGIPIAVAEDDQLTPAVAFDGTDFLAAWEDYRNGSVSDIYGARLTAQGVVRDPAGIPISSAQNAQLMPALAFDGTNLLVAWEDYRSVSSFDIYGARVTPEGAVLDPDGFAISQAANDQYSLAVGFDGDDFLVAWGDLRNGSKYDLYGARVSPEGAVLDPNGFAISQAANDQYYPAIVFGATEYLVVWEDDRGGNGYDIYGSRVSPEGAVLDPGGFIASQAANAEDSPATGFDGEVFLVAWADDRNGSGWDIYGARVTPQGELLDPAGFAISQAARDQRLPAVCFDGSDFLVAWQDYRSDPAGDIYGARVTPQGEVLDAGGFVISQAADEQSAPAVAFDGANSLVVWEDYRDGTRFHVYGARVTPQGGVLDASGIQITTVPGYQYAPAIAFDSANLLVVWQDSRNGSDWDVYGCRVTPQGELLDPSGIALSQAEHNQRSPAAVFDGTEFLVAWEDNRFGYDYDVFAARATPQGELLDPAGRPVSIYPNDQLKPALAFDGANFLLVWQDFRTLVDFDVYAARMTQEGSVFEGGPVVREQGDQLYPRLCGGSSGSMLLVYQGWTGAVGGKTYNSDRVWGRTNPGPGIQEDPALQPSGFKPAASIIRGLLFLPASPLTIHTSLFDITGRQVMALRPGVNDVSALSPGVYFVRFSAGGKVSTGRVALIR